MAAIGIYGVVSHAVSRRTRELGIRMSLGATARDVVRMAIGGGRRLVMVGGVCGMVLAGAVTWAISGFLFGVGPNDIATFLAIPASSYLSRALLRAQFRRVRARRISWPSKSVNRGANSSARSRATSAASTSPSTSAVA